MISPEESTIKFYVKSSVNIEGHFDKWDATLTFTSPKLSTGVLDIKIQAATVNTGSGTKDDKLKSKDFFDVKKDHSSRNTAPRLAEVLEVCIDVIGS